MLDARLVQRLRNFHRFIEGGHSTDVQVLDAHEVGRFLHAANHIIVEGNVARLFQRRKHVFGNQARPVVVRQTAVPLVLRRQECVADDEVFAIVVVLDDRHFRRFARAEERQQLRPAQGEHGERVVVGVVASRNIRADGRQRSAIFNRRQHTGVLAAHAPQWQTHGLNRLRLGVVAVNQVHIVDVLAVHRGTVFAVVETNQAARTVRHNHVAAFVAARRRHVGQQLDAVDLAAAALFNRAHGQLGFHVVLAQMPLQRHGEAQRFRLLLARQRFHFKVFRLCHAQRHKFLGDARHFAGTVRTGCADPVAVVALFVHDVRCLLRLCVQLLVQPFVALRRQEGGRQVLDGVHAHVVDESNAVLNRRCAEVAQRHAHRVAVIGAARQTGVVVVQQELALQVVLVGLVRHLVRIRVHRVGIDRFAAALVVDGDVRRLQIRVELQVVVFRKQLERRGDIRVFVRERRQF